MKKAQLLITLASGLVAVALLVPTSAQIGPGPSGPPIRVTPMLPTLVGGPIVGTTGTFSGAINSSSDITGRDLIAGAARFIYWTGRSLFSSPADGQLNINNNAATSGIGLDVSTDGTLKIRNRAQAADGNLTAASVATGTNTATSGNFRLPNAGTIVSRNAANTGDYTIVSSATGDRVFLGGGGNFQINIDPGTQDVVWSKPLVALGGGAAPTLGTIGGTGPTVSGQNAWMRIFDSTGAAMWIPVWK